ncbi:hypothetical protein K435DRAFT_798336 [Dendrothele bispora CBS 962.96]|uniref:Uncharacterized protein n=1 Tax=Dendrothele bispora (strain CBS 962.96) TaxID=1314807 RepID=A0A4S8M0S5_DENBC|nr:hypothetical protein K435DRAFT_798336 [Dendrothele bispora CBS 962.96]
MVKIIAFELDDTLWKGQLDEKRFGKGRNASPKRYPNCNKALHQFNGIRCTRALFYYKARDPKDQVQPITSMITYNEVKNVAEIYQVIKEGKPFKPGNDNDDQYLTMLAFELRNLNMIKELKAPKPENFTGWFMSTKVFGTALWKTPLYKQHPFSVPFQRLIKKAFHLIVDEIEETVRKYGVEHRGIAVRMQWDGKQYIRRDDVLVWAESGSGAKYTPEEFRRYWITWMVKTEYEANVRRNAITEEDSKKFLKDLTWWFQR